MKQIIRLSIAILLLFFASVGVAENDFLNSFVGYKQIDIKSNCGNVTVLYKNIDIKKIYDENYKNIDVGGGAFSSEKNILSFYLKKNTFILKHSTGVVCDDGFYIKNVRNDKIVWSGNGTFLIITHDRLYVYYNLYIRFDLRKKFIYSLEHNNYYELKQPYYYVGINGKVKKHSITLYSDEALKNQLATLPIESEIELLLHKYTSMNNINNMIFLAKTPFGLVGWVKLKNWQNVDGLNYIP